MTHKEIKDELISLAYKFRDSESECTANCAECELLQGVKLRNSEDQVVYVNLCDTLIGILNGGGEDE